VALTLTTALVILGTGVLVIALFAD